MPPRTAPRGAGGTGSGAGRGRGGSGGRGRGRGTPIALQDPAPNPNAPQGSAHVTTIGVKRPAYGVSGRPIAVFANCFETTIPEKTIYHYDEIAGEKTLPARLNMLINQALQQQVAPDIFIAPAAYDGKKNLFSTHNLFPEAKRTFDVTLAGAKPQAGGKPPKVFKVALKKVAEINPELLHRFIEGNQSNDKAVSTAIMALNVVIRMDPTQKYPFNVRSFFPGKEMKLIGSGIQLSRGYFQSVRPAIGRMVINVDISTGMFFRSGPLPDLILDFLKQPLGNPAILSAARGPLSDIRIRRTVIKFLMGVRVAVVAGDAPPKPGQPTKPPRTILGVSDKDADQIFFVPSQGGRAISVADYFRQIRGRPLRFPKTVCVALGNKDSWIPIELLAVVPGQLMRKEVPSDRTKDVVEFSTKAPKERLASIRSAFPLLNYGGSPFVRNFGMKVEEKPVEINARVLKHPTLRYGAARGKGPTKVNPTNGSWNMREKKFHLPAKVGRWFVIIFESDRRFDQQTARDMVMSFSAACNEYGMTVLDPRPEIFWGNPRSSIINQLKDAGKAVIAKHKEPPALIVVILPEQGDDIWREVKHFGDIVMGIPTQCMKANKCGRAKPQYFANVCLKLNGKLGGINTIPDPETENTLTDPNNPTIVMGADVFHPAPGSVGRPSFAALVGSTDSEAAKYVAEMSVQDGSFEKRKEMITGLQGMCKNVLKLYMEYRVNRQKKKPAEAPPKRLIFYRDGVSEGEFAQVLDKELPQIRDACADLKINPKITLIVVGKRHHIRFFPKNESDAGDKLGNCPAGTVVDRVIGHPTEFDFYLQSHGGLLGTSRPAHYSVLHDENNFGVDTLQALSFTLCHVYAASTRSVSIPAPVYYADKVCARAKNHFDPNVVLDSSETASLAAGSEAGSKAMDKFMEAFKPINKNQKAMMFFL